MYCIEQRNEPRWKTIRHWIVRQINSGEWPETMKLPSIRALSRMFDTSVTTVQRALGDLESSCYIRAEPRTGYFVAAKTQAVPADETGFASVAVNVNHAVVAMLSRAGRLKSASLSSAVLHDDLIPHTLLKKCLSAVADRYDSLLTGFIPPPGLPDLRRRLAALMLTRGVVCGPDDILITSGDTIGLELALEAVAPQGGVVAIEMPTYYGMLQIIERLGMRALPIRTHPRTGMDVDHLEEALKHQQITAIYLNPTLQNPQGFIMPDDARARLSRLAHTAGIPIIEDDIFFDLTPGKTRPRALKSLAAGSRTLYCSSFSKTIAPGYRVGWCVPGDYRDAILAQMFARNLSVSSLAQQVLNVFLERGYLERHGARLQDKLAAVRDYLDILVRTEFPEGSSYIPPAGGFIHWVVLPANTDMSALASLAEQQGCHIAGSGIFFPDDRQNTTVRLCLGSALSPGMKLNLKILCACAHQAVIAGATSAGRTRPRR
ncbi:PLP-dependent aminotransferase family protein [Zobellella iuensis]|uniref:PLP-dependent aminotransferase family protein n=1 Tax=Zobellella iuensis TaxID=2803811 RepID=A0ABS1QRH6_9GAMM|nr:PLP-dependent aminotransferase family protein [Zobellella iuensis]MBL1377468.1 PLP-dependent aminotransferase family protein [Zobellella iuensis]